MSRSVVQARHSAAYRTHPPLPELTGIAVSVTTLYETTQFYLYMQLHHPIILEQFLKFLQLFCYI
jgi:hypothetical protein